MFRAHNGHPFRILYTCASCLHSPSDPCILGSERGWCALRTDRVSVLTQWVRTTVLASLRMTYPLPPDASCARGAGVPEPATMARTTFERLERTDPMKVFYCRLLID